MTAHCAIVLLAGAALGTAAATPAAAQVDDGIVLNIMRECARIDDPTARLACYDNNIRAAGATPRASVPGQMQVPQGGSGAAPSTAGPTGFGNEDIRRPQRVESGSSNAGGDLASLTSRVARVDPREPGVYLLTLENGAHWLFAESVDQSYRVPRSGDLIEIDRASLGSFLMRYNGQSGIRVRRVR